VHKDYFGCILMSCGALGSIIDRKQELRLGAQAPIRPNALRKTSAGNRNCLLGYEIGLQLDIAETIVVTIARKECRLIDQRHDRANDKVPVGVETDRCDGLYEEDILILVELTSVEVARVLEGNTNQVAKRILRLFGEAIGHCRG